MAAEARPVIYFLRMEMNDRELERTLLETLRLAKENREYLMRIDRRQRWSRNWNMLYWGVIIVLAVAGYYFAFPYLKTIRDDLSGAWGQVGELTGLLHPAGQGGASAR